MEFEKRKAATLVSISSTEMDKSPKGTLDEPILPLIKSLNLHPSYFTTSSCSGRISILCQPITTTTVKKKARGGSWLYITHEPADPDSVVNLLFSDSPTQEGELVFRFEPFILAVECKDLASAQSLVSAAISCGFRESGITNAHKRVIIAIRCSIRLEVPLGLFGEVRVSPGYVRYLVGVANDKLELNRKRTECFLQVLESKLLPNEVKEKNDSLEEQQQEEEYEEGVGRVASNGAVDSTQLGVGDAERMDLDTPLDLGEREKYCCERRKGVASCSFALIPPSVHLNISTEQRCHKLLKGNVDQAIGQNRVVEDLRAGSLEAPQCSISVVKMAIVGEPVDKLFLWGHSSCTLHNSHPPKVLIFGGFGGLGRHARRNDTLMLDPLSGILEAITVEEPPSPRLGHTSSMIGESLFVIGGRCDPTKILNDVWVFNTCKKKWALLKRAGVVFHPRHRHAAAVVGRKIYVFGGLRDEIACSSMHVLDTENSEWSEINVHGEWPCARHSHAMVANDSKLYMFGGYDGEKALQDLYSFDSIACLWKKEKTSGRVPFARFSHSMFVYKNYLGIVGGCPLQQHYQELALLDLRFGLWKHVILDSVDKNLFVRSTSDVVGDDLVIIGGGASCYAFGTYFSEPMKMNLLPCISLNVSIDLEGKCIHQAEEIRENVGCIPPKHSQTRTQTSSGGREFLMDVKYWVLELKRKHAKLGKDILKKFGWLDVGRKAYSRENGTHICLPVTTEFYKLFHEKEHGQIVSFDSMDSSHSPGSIAIDKTLENDEVSCSIALNYLLLRGASLLIDEVVCIRKAPKSPQKILMETVGSLLIKRDLPIHLLEQIPTRWERLGDIFVLPVASFKDPMWELLGGELWKTVAKSLGACRLARQGRVAATGTRDSTLEMLVGDNGWVDHRENGIFYSFDATKCMFSWGNLSEKLRMARLECKGEVVVDLFAGIGYFTLPFLIGGKAELVYSCEWNPNALEALRRNIQTNAVTDRCVILEGDNRLTAPKGVADRVCLGLIPSSEESWPTAVRALRNQGGMLHVHGIAKDTEENSWSDHVARSMLDIAKSEGRSWDISVQHLERVKWYAPHIRHLVADVRCRQHGGGFTALLR